MANTKDNRRVQYTKASLKQSLLSHLKEKPVDRITVKEICETADLNRGTFYAYYGSPAELLSDIEMEFYVDVLSSVASFRKASDIITIFTEALTVLRDRLEFSAVLFGEHGDMAFLQQLIDVARDTCLLHWGVLAPKLDEATKQKMYDFVSYGSMRVIRKWLQGGAEESPESLARFLSDMCNDGVLRMLKRK